MHVAGGAPEQVGKARPVGHEAADRHVLLRLEHSGQAVARQELDDTGDVKLVERIDGHMSASGRSRSIAAKAGSKSPTLRTSTGMSAIPAAGAAIFISVRTATLEALSGLAR